MRIEEYLCAYEEYRNSVLTLERILYDKKDAKEERGLEELDERAELRREYERKKGILSRATKKLHRAISRISDVRLTNYLLARYICSMKNEEIAYKFNYCERQVYRLASLAKKRLYEELLFEMPTAKRGERKRVYRRKLSPRHRRYRKYAYHKR